MTELPFLQDLVVVFAAALVVVAVLGRFKIPSIAGFIIAGALVGPAALGLVQDIHRVEVLAEVGVVLLMFGIGLELSLERIRRLWSAVLIGGTIQVSITILATTAIGVGMGLQPGRAVFLGFVVAVSSTAIVLRGLSSRGELEAPHGRLAVGILIFQDLCVVLMIVALPFLAGTGGSATMVLTTIGRALAILAGIFVAARLVVPLVLMGASRTRRRDVFILAVALVCLGTAWVVSSAGVSVALGAFLAGLVVSGSEYRHQAMSDLFPLREVLASVFFVSVGMLLDMGAAVERTGPILAILAAILAGKFLIVFFTAAVMRLPLRVCILTGAALAQVGEFSFVLFRAAGDFNLVETSLAGDLTVAVILSMLVTPFTLSLGPRMAAGASRLNWLTRLLQVRIPEARVDQGQLYDHVIIAGYGLAGQELAEALGNCDKPFVTVDLNPANVRLAARQGLQSYFGDVTSPEVLHRLCVENARGLVLTVNDPDAAARAVRAARRLAPDLTVIARSQYVTDIAGLIAAGASRVIVAETAAAAEVTSCVLEEQGVSQQSIDIQLARIRARRAEQAAE
jgi:CPA2 family monovalent cation:H+ antiporter-2